MGGLKNENSTGEKLSEKNLSEKNLSEENLTEKKLQEKNSTKINPTEDNENNSAETSQTENEIDDSKKKKNTFRSTVLPVIIIMLSAIGIFYFSIVMFRIYKFKNEYDIQPLTENEKQIFDSVLNKEYPNRNDILKKLPYTMQPIELDITARSAILVDASNGCVIYEKNADQIIPPASMTKLAVMFVVFQEIATGRISLEDRVPLPPESWASNMPPHSSLMFLGRNQRVTLDELLLGLAVCSGNDAAYALAFYVSGGMEKFIERMNREMELLGLEHTRFVESSGYSELNTTTAREMAAFARVYISRYPEALSRYHSRLSFTYPKEQNLAPEDIGKPRAQDWSNGLPANITMGITQQNTNKLLGLLEGCDGLKTGYIDESGYNIALTATRDGTRFISVTLGGAGRTTAEGNANRVKDGTTMMEWAFDTFADSKKTNALHSYIARVTGAKNTYVNLIPTEIAEALTVPFITAQTPREAADMVKVAVNIPNYIDGGTSVGTEYGNVSFFLGDVLLMRVPLVADRNIQEASFITKVADMPLKKLVFNKR